MNKTERLKEIEAEMIKLKTQTDSEGKYSLTYQDSPEYKKLIEESEKLLGTKHKTISEIFKLKGKNDERS